MFKNLILSQDTLESLQKHQKYMNNMANNILEQEQERQENMKRAFENIEFYTLEDFKNELFPILNDLNKRIEILESKYDTVNNI